MRSLFHLRNFVSVVALLPALGLAGGAAGQIDRPIPQAAKDGAADICRAMTGMMIAPNVTVTTAEYAGAGETVGETKVAVPFCRIVGVASPTPDSHIGFEVWLPPATSWNGKFQGVGSGGSAGTIATRAMLEALQAGYATMATDNGHVTDMSQKNGTNEQTWALGHPEKVLDFAFRAEHVSTVAAKNLVQRFYGKKPFESYFVGCSQGGHHALMEASKYPDDYDGIVAGAPGWHWANQMINATWDSLPARKDPAAITPQSVAILNRAVTAACDRLDGVVDRVISDPRRCNFDPVSIQCSTAGQAECLTPVQVDAAQRIYSGARKSDGTVIFQGLARGSELNWARIWAGPMPGGSSFDMWRYSVFQDKDYDSLSFDFDKDTDRALNTKLAGMSVADIYNVKPDLTRFNARGGKLIIYHGWADQQISPYGSVDFYQHIVATLGQAKTDAFLRMFMLPGIGHCSGGPGTGNIGGATPAVSHDASHDVVEALDAWVTKKKAPSVLIGTHINESRLADRTRPLCAYPKEAKYKGSGDTNDAVNFTCAASL